MSYDFSKLILVIGAPRSGTTLLQRLLGTHPSVYAGPEFDYLPKIAELYDEMVKSIRSGRIDQWVDRELARDGIREMVGRFLFAQASATKHTHVSEKTPGNILTLDALTELLPEARYVCLVRDPRDVVASMLEVGRRMKSRGGFTGNTYSATDFLLKAWSSLERYVCKRKEEAMLIRYEDLVGNPLSVLNLVFTHVGLSKVSEINLTHSTFRAPNNEGSWGPWYSKKLLESQDIKRDSVKRADVALRRWQRAYIETTLAQNPLAAKLYNIHGKRGFTNMRWPSWIAVSEYVTKRSARNARLAAGKVLYILRSRGGSC